MTSNQNQITFDEDAQRLLISWNNRTCRAEGLTKVFLVLFWLICAAATFYTTRNLFTEFNLLLALASVFGWAGTLLVPFVLARLWRREWIWIDAHEMSWGNGAPLQTKMKQTLVRDISELTYGNVAGKDGVESSPTLNVWIPRKMEWAEKSRDMLAYWLHRDHKKAIFDRIDTFVTQRGIALTVRVHNDYE